MNAHSLLKTTAILAICTTSVAACGSDGGDGSDDATATSSSAGQSTDGVLQVTVPLGPIEYLAAAVGGDAVEVTNVAPSAPNPHDVELSAKDTAAVVDSDAFIYLGENFQPAVEDLAEGDAKAVAFDLAPHVDLESFNVSQRLKLSEGGEEHGDEHGEEHGDEHGEEHGDEHAHGEEHGDEHAHGEDEIDPHFWQDPQRLMKAADAIANHYGSLAPDSADDFTARAAEVKEALGETESAYAAALASCDGASLVTAHTAFGYLAGRYNLNQIGVAGLDPEDEPSGDDMAKLADFVKDNNVKTIYTDKMASDALAKTLADETNSTTGVLDPGGVTITDQKSYDDVMASNLKALEEGLACS